MNIVRDGSFAIWSKGHSDPIGPSPPLVKSHRLGLYLGQTKPGKYIRYRDFFPRVWARFRRPGFQPSLCMLQIVNQSQGKLFLGGREGESKSLCRRGSRRYPLPPGCLQRRSGRLRARRTFGSLERLMGAGARLEPVAQPQRDPGRVVVWCAKLAEQAWAPVEICCVHKWLQLRLTIFVS